MKHTVIKTALIALALSTCAGLSLAEEPQPQKTKPPASAASEAKAPAKKSKAAPPKIEPVDINSASKNELKKLPGVGDAEADKIIAGRPYLSKAHLVTHNVISEGLYLGLKDQIVARQKDAKFGKAATTK
jgi:DNA uptake protein ComE-like DNA-binding protein